MRKSDIKLEVALMFVGIIVFLSMTTLSAQEGFPGECWERIENCTSSLTPGEIQEQCCPVITQEISDERECFCGVKPLVLQNVTIADTLSDLLTLCSVASSFDTLCPGIHISSPFISFISRKWHQYEYIYTSYVRIQLIFYSES